MLERARKRLDKRAEKGFRGYPVATVALYGPDDTMATKLTVGIVPAENAEVTDLQRWFSEGSDIRNDFDVAEEVLAFIADTGAKSVVMTDRIIGCPHEEGIDYEGSNLPGLPILGRAGPLDRQASTVGTPRLLTTCTRRCTEGSRMNDRDTSWPDIRTARGDRTATHMHAAPLSAANLTDGRVKKIRAICKA